MSKQQRRSSGMVAAGLAGLAVMVFTAAAGASPVRFDNPAGAGHFVWFGGTEADPIGLNITLGAGNQTGSAAGLSTFNQGNTADGAHVLTPIGAPSRLHIHGDPAVFLVGFDFGESIPSAFGWDTHGWSNHTALPTWHLPWDEPTYVGVKIDLGSGDQYGWIGVEFSSADLTLDTFAWGYETEVGVPIEAGVPEPGTLALLAFGALAATRRQRRA